MVKVLDRDTINRMTGGYGGTTGRTGGGGGGGSSYTLPLAADGVRGGVQVGYTQTGRNYPVQLDNEKMYVNVPWTDHYAWSDITDKPTTATRWPSWTEVTSKPTSKTAWGKTYLNASSEFQNISGDMNSVGNISFSASGKSIGGFVYFNTTNGYLGIGDANPAYRLEVSGNCRISSKLMVATTDSTYELNVGGTIYATGSVTALSDARKKRVMGDVVLSAEQIAQMPAVRFEWKDPKKPGMFIGTLAQNWREILPEAVHTLGDGTLSFDYQSAAIVGLINLADEIVAIKNKLKRYGFK